MKGASTDYAGSRPGGGAADLRSKRQGAVGQAKRGAEENVAAGTLRAQAHVEDCALGEGQRVSGRKRAEWIEKEVER